VKIKCKPGLRSELVYTKERKEAMKGIGLHMPLKILNRYSICYEK